MLCESKGNLESSFELTYQTKRQLTLIGLALRRFASGLDYIIILPSLYFYVQSFNAGFYLLGLIIAADSLVAFFLSPLIEKLSEKWQRIRILGFLANLIQITGSMIYALPLYYFMPLVGRLISGLGQSCSGALYCEVKRVTSHEERNRVMIFMEGVRLFGVVIGPGMNFFLKDFDLRFGPWVIDHRTAPGFFMAIVWLLVEVVHIFTVYDLSLHPNAYRELPEHDSEEDPLYQKTPSISQPFSANHELSTVKDEHNPASDEDEPKSEDHHTDSSDGEAKPSKEIRVSESEGETTRHSRPSSRSRKLQELPAMNQSVCQLLCRRDVIVILICEFLMFFNQTAFETLMLLIGVDQLGFSISILSTIFIGAGVEMVAVIVVVWSANKALDAKYLLITSISAALLASFARLAVGFAGTTNEMGCIVMTLLMGFFTIMGTPIASVAGKSLLPKLTPPETHAFYQSAFAVSQHLGLIVGPLVASVMYVHLVLFSALTIAVFLIVYLLLLPTVEKMRFAAHGCGAM
jgi:ceroid-lipofuscinosis MFS transporter 7